MTDPTDRIEYFETLHKMDDATKMLVDGVKLIALGGPEGIKEVANSNPEMILTAFQAMSDIIDMQRKEVNDLNEKLFEIYDKIEETANALEK